MFTTQYKMHHVSWGEKTNNSPHATNLAKAAFAQHLDEVEFIQAQALGLALPNFSVLTRTRQLPIARRCCCPMLLPSVVKGQGFTNVVFKFFDFCEQE